MEPEPAFVVAFGVFLLRMGGCQGRVDIQGHPAAGVGPAVFGPHPGADLAHHIVDSAGRSGCLGHVGDHPPERRLRTDIAQHAFGWMEHPKVGATIATGVQHQQAMDQQPTPIHDRHGGTPIGHHTGEPAGQTKPVGVLGERPQTAQRDDLVGLIDTVIAD